MREPCCCIARGRSDWALHMDAAESDVELLEMVFGNLYKSLVVKGCITGLREHSTRRKSMDNRNPK